MAKGELKLEENWKLESGEIDKFGREKVSEGMFLEQMIEWEENKNKNGNEIKRRTVE